MHRGLATGSGSNDVAVIRGNAAAGTQWYRYNGLNRTLSNDLVYSCLDQQ